MKEKHRQRMNAAAKVFTERLVVYAAESRKEMAGDPATMKEQTIAGVFAVSDIIEKVVKSSASLAAAGDRDRVTAHCLSIFAMWMEMMNDGLMGRVNDSSEESRGFLRAEFKCWWDSEEGLVDSVFEEAFIPQKNALAGYSNTTVGEMGGLAGKRR